MSINMKHLKRRAAYALMAILLLSTFLIAGSIIYYAQKEDRLAHEKVDVLANWQLCTGEFQVVDNRDACVETKSYKPGDLVIVNTKVTKLINVTGQSNRFVQCHKPHSNEWDALIPVNVTKASGSAAKNRNGSFTIGLPLSIGVLPNTCRIYVSVTYNVNKYHPSFQESAYTNEFNVEPRPGLITQNSTETLLFTNPPASGGQKSSQVPSPTPIIIYRNDNPTPDQENSPATNGGSQPQPNVVERLLNGVVRLLPL